MRNFEERKKKFAWNVKKRKVQSKHSKWYIFWIIREISRSFYSLFFYSIDYRFSLIGIFMRSFRGELPFFFFLQAAVVDSTRKFWSDFAHWILVKRCTTDENPYFLANLDAYSLSHCKQHQRLTLLLTEWPYRECIFMYSQ